MSNLRYEGKQNHEISREMNELENMLLCEVTQAQKDTLPYSFPCAEGIDCAIFCFVHLIWNASRNQEARKENFQEIYYVRGIGEYR